MRSSVAARLGAGLLEKVPRDHQESALSLRRRRQVVAVTGLAGSTLLQRSLSRRPGSRSFYGLAAAVAGTWAVGGVVAGPLHLGRELSPAGHLRRPVLVPVATGTLAFGALYGCALVARRIPVLEVAVSAVLAFAERGDSATVLATTLLNGAAEEVFFRGALYAAVPDGHQVAVSTAAYTLTTAATRNPALVMAAAGMGTLFALQRRASGGIQAPALTHLVWSALVLRFLPPLFREGHRARH